MLTSNTTLEPLCFKILLQITKKGYQKNDDIGVINKLVPPYPFITFHSIVFNVSGQFGPLTSQECPKFENYQNLTSSVAFCP